MAQNVAHNVIYTLVDTQQTMNAYDPSNEKSDMTQGGFTFDTSWMIYVVLIEVVLGLGFVTLGFFLIKNLMSNRKTEKEENAK